MDSAISPDMGNNSANGSGDQANEACVPLKDLAIDGKTPAVGDTVDFAIEAKVTRVEGEMAYVQPTKVNGQDVTAENQGDAQGASEPQFDDSGAYQQPMAQPM